MRSRVKSSIHSVVCLLTRYTRSRRIAQRMSEPHVLCAALSAKLAPHQVPRVIVQRVMHLPRLLPPGRSAESRPHDAMATRTDSASYDQLKLCQPSKLVCLWLDRSAVDNTLHCHNRLQGNRYSLILASIRARTCTPEPICDQHGARGMEAHLAFLKTAAYSSRETSKKVRCKILGTQLLVPMATSSQKFSAAIHDRMKRP